MITTFTVIGTPKPRGSAHAFVVGDRAVVTDSNRTALRPWMQAVKLAAVEQIERDGRARLEGPVAVRLTFYLRCPKSAPKRRIPKPATIPDVDKLARGVLDAITGVLFDDDKQVTRLTALKRYAGREEDPSPLGLERCEIVVRQDPAVGRRVEEAAS